MFDSKYSITIVSQMARHIWIVLFAAIFAQAWALECYDCRNVTDTNTCNRTSTCSANQSCLMHAATLVSSERTYNLNCTDNNLCHQNSSSSPLIGRSVESQKSSSTKRDAPPCHECCSTPLCNKALCNHPRPTNCEDDPSVDCAKLDSIFNVCADIHKAKLVCPRFCNLCNVVDGNCGNWNWWSSWSGCDVTCANGIQTRHRFCTDPAPKNGGLDCLGTGTESQSCIMEACPVHGGWSQWSPWGSCSVTCDIGMQRRDRSCDNPYPTKGGDHCFGDSRDDRICLTTGCTNGHWSAWENWSSCSASCGGGRKTRNRACNNPSPSLLGRYCNGPPQDVDVCNVSSCTGLDIVFVVGIPAIKECVYNNFDRECRVEFREYISRPNAQFDLQTATFTAANPGNYWFAWTFIGKWLSAWGNLKMTCYLNKNNASLSTILLDRIDTVAESGVLIYMSNHDTVKLEKCQYHFSSSSPPPPVIEIGSTLTGILMH